MTDKRKRPRDANLLAKRIVDIATGDVDETESEKTTQRRKAGEKGAKARAVALTPEQRSEIAQIAAQTRWKKATD